MKTACICFALLLLFVVSGTQAGNSLERVDPLAEKLQLVIDIDESVIIEIASSDKTTSSVSISTDVEEVVLQREETKYIIKKINKARNTPNPKKSNTPTPSTAHHDESRAFAAVPSSVGFCLSILAVACHFVFGERKSFASLCIVLVIIAVSSASFTSASVKSKAQVTVRVFLPDNIEVTISQNQGRKGVIDLAGDVNSPIKVKSLQFTTSTNTELKDIAVSSCSSVSIESEGSIVVGDFQAPTSGSCTIAFNAGKQVLATLADGYLGSFNLDCQQKRKSANRTCSSVALGSAVKHSSTAVRTSEELVAFYMNSGDTLCDGTTGHNTLTATGTKVKVDFGSSADCATPAAASSSPLPKGTANVLPSSTPPAPSTSSYVGSACRRVNGIQWCHNPTTCGEACEDVCKFFGFTISVDDVTWFNAQNSLTKCQNIATAFGISSIDLDVWSYGCLEDFPGIHNDPSQLIGPLYCSTDANCPNKHRTATDQLGASCSVQSRKSICPCQ